MEELEIKKELEHLRTLKINFVVLVGEILEGIEKIETPGEELVNLKKYILNFLKDNNIKL